MRARISAFFLALGFLPAVGAETAPHVLLVTVDTLRADHLSVYGGPADSTPHLDALAESGVLFEDTLSVIGKTGPSFASAFTSLFPPSHGARRNGVRMRDDVPSLARILAENGYTTAAFISNWTLKSHLSGVDRGFGHYDETFNLKRNNFGARERDAPNVVAAAVEWVEGDRAASTKPLLLWLHFSEPHDPYVLHERFAAPEPKESDRTDGWQKRHRYRSEVAFTDHWIGEALRQLAPHLPEKSTYVIFWSDHGESLGEHRYWGHGKNVHWPNLQVPLILRGPDVPSDRRVAHPASLVDVLPTLLELLDIEVDMDSHGTSLVSSWQRPPDPGRHRYAFGERHSALTKKGRTRYNHPLAISVQTQEMKAVFHFGNRKIDYYDLRTDALELEPSASPPIETRPPIGRQLANWYGDLPKFEQKGGELSDEDRRQLEALGYLGGGH